MRHYKSTFAKSDCFEAKNISDNAGFSITQNFVARATRRDYLAGMMVKLRTVSSYWLLLPVLCIALVIAGGASVATMGHAMHVDRTITLPTENIDATGTHHASHNAASEVTDPECCAQETETATTCHAMACCVSEHQAGAFPAASKLGRDICARSMVNTTGPSIHTPLPERPPRHS